MTVALLLATFSFATVESAGAATRLDVNDVGSLGPDDSAIIEAEDEGRGGSGGDSPSDDNGGDGGGPVPCAEVTAGGVCLRNPEREVDVFSVRPIRLSDLVAFRPAAPAQGMQPNGWAVVGLPANFVAGVEPQTQSGVLLGLPVTIRFTPVRWTWDYGDGVFREAASGGASWADLRVAEFSETATSHVYGERGEFTVSLTVHFAAEYQFAGRPWRIIAGTLPVQADQLTIVAAKAKTVLVNENCLQNPSGPGC